MAWPRLNRLDLITIGVTVAVAGYVTVPRLPPGICFGDSGELQLACATLGIAHPPGYAGYVSLGYLVTLFPAVDPAYMVSLATLGCGMVTLLLCILMQVRLGVGTAVACTMGLGLISHPRVWSNMLGPEVYMPSLMFVAASAYALTRYSRRGLRRDLWIAALLFGFALANRPPVALTLPFFLLAWWWASKRWDGSRQRALRSALLMSTLGALPGAYTLGYLWVRDTPHTPYNYIEQFNAEADLLPSAKAGATARAERIVWLVTGQQFSDIMGNTWEGVRQRLRWLCGELIPWRWVSIQVEPLRSVVLGIAFILAVLAAIIALRRCPVQALLLGGIAMGSVIFVCTYRVYRNAADMLPLLFVLPILGGVAFSVVIPRQQRRWHLSLALGLTGTACIGTILDAPNRPEIAHRLSALSFLDNLDMPTLPDRAVICSRWGTSPPLWYAQTVLFNRRDIHVINALEHKWKRMTEGIADRPIFATAKPSIRSGFTGTPFRNLFRLRPVTAP